MRIAIVNRHVNDVLGGSEMQCHNIAAGLLGYGHDVRYVAPWGRAAYETPYEVAAVAPSPRAIADAVLGFRPDVVYWRFNKHLFYRSVRRLAQVKVPIVFAISNIADIEVTSHMSNPRTGIVGFAKATKQSVLAAYNHLGFKHVAAVTSLNPDYLGKLSVERQRFVPNSVEMHSVSFSWPKPYVVWVANLKPAKRPELFLKLAHELGNKGVDFLMIGDVQSAEYEWIASAGSPVHYLGKKSLQESNGIIANALVLAHTCKPEGFGNNFLQAWLHAIPTVSLGFDPAGYIGRHGLGGYAGDDWEVFKEQIQRLISDADLRRNVGQRARRFAESRFSVAKTVETLEQFLAEVVADLRADAAQTFATENWLRGRA